jgi:hypothetical protein
VLPLGAEKKNRASIKRVESLVEIPKKFGGQQVARGILEADLRPLSVAAALDHHGNSLIDFDQASPCHEEWP